MPPLTIHIDLFAPDRLGRIATLDPRDNLAKDYELWKAQITRIFELLRAFEGQADIRFIFPEWETLAGGTSGKVNARAEAPLSHKLGILFLRTYHLSLSSDFFWHLPNSKLRPISQGQNQEIDLPYFPILSIGTEDIAPLFAEEQQEELDYHPYLSQEIDARVKFLDSNIWHRYVSLKQCPLDTEDFERRLKSTFVDILSYFKAGLYDTVAAKASLEFDLRMLRESFIARLGDKGHNKVVTPFKFHSETRMKLKAEKEKEFFNQKWNDIPLKDQIKWRLLMVDDYAADPISAAEPKLSDSPSRKDITSKMDWIYVQMSDFKGLLHIDFPKVETNDSNLAEYRENTPPRRKSADKGIIPKSLEMMKKTTYDIILLDYLLGTKIGQPPHSSDQREYGYEFLLKLLKDSDTEKFKFTRGPVGLFWIFPISSFPFALSDKLRQLGINNYSDLWHLAGGGDPISTPDLFQYNLIKFLKQQVIEVLMDDNTLVNYFNPISKIKVIEVWSEAMSKKLDNLSFKSIILKREAKDSVFAKSVFPIIRNNEFATLIRTLKKLTRILSSGTRTLDSYREFNQAWDSFQNENLQYPKTIRLIQKKLDQTIYKPLIKAIKKIESSDGEELSLIDQRLIELPEEIAQLSQLREIWLNGNQLEELPQWLTGLTKLEKIYLSGNRLYNFPSVLVKMKDQLNYIDLRDNYFLDLSFKLADDEYKVRAMIKEAERKLQDFSIHKKTVNSLLEKNQLREAADYVSHILNDYSLENVNDIRDGLINVKNNLTSMTRAEMLNYSSSSEIMEANNRIINSIKYLLEQLEAHFDKPITD